MHNHGSITDCADNVPSILFININSRGVCAEPSGEHIAARKARMPAGIAPLWHRIGAADRGQRAFKDYSDATAFLG